MKNIRLFTVLFILLLSSAYSQDVMRLTLEIKNLTDGTGFCGNVYLRTDEGISMPFYCTDGSVQLLFYENLIQTNDAFISIRQGAYGIANVNMVCLLSSKAPIKLPKMSVEIKDFKNVPMPTELSEAIKLLPCRSVEPKLRPDLQEYGDHFPKKVFQSNNDYTEYLAKWFSWNLQCLDEPVLCHKYPNDVYRFTWTSFSYFYDYDPYSVRIEVQDDGSAILFCSYDYNNKENTKSDVCIEVTPLSSQSLEQFLQKINGIDMKDKIFTTSIANHSAFNSLESYINGEYRVIFRGNGEEEGLDEIREFLWKLAGLGDNKIVHHKLRIE